MSVRNSRPFSRFRREVKKNLQHLTLVVFEELSKNAIGTAFPVHRCLRNCGSRCFVVRVAYNRADTSITRDGGSTTPSLSRETTPLSPPSYRRRPRLGFSGTGCGRVRNRLRPDAAIPPSEPSVPLYRARESVRVSHFAIWVFPFFVRIYVGPFRRVDSKPFFFFFSILFCDFFVVAPGGRFFDDIYFQLFYIHMYYVT